MTEAQLDEGNELLAWINELEMIERDMAKNRKDSPEAALLFVCKADSEAVTAIFHGANGLLQPLVSSVLTSLRERIAQLKKDLKKL